MLNGKEQFYREWSRKIKVIELLKWKCLATEIVDFKVKFKNVFSLSTWRLYNFLIISSAKYFSAMKSDLEQC